MSDKVVSVYTRADHRTTGLSGRELFDAMVNSFQTFLTFITERSVLDDAGIIYSPQSAVIHTAIGQISSLMLAILTNLD